MLVGDNIDKTVRPRLRNIEAILFIISIRLLFWIELTCQISLMSILLELLHSPCFPPKLMTLPLNKIQNIDVSRVGGKHEVL